MKAEKLSAKDREALLKVLQARFEKNMNRHKGLEWAKVQAKVQANADKLWSLNEMEKTGGEPDVVGHDKRPANTSSSIVRRKLRKGAPVFVTTVRDGNHGKNIGRKRPPWIWPRPWVSSF